jgi:hypothetical protein
MLVCAFVEYPLNDDDGSLTNEQLRDIRRSPRTTLVRRIVQKYQAIAYLSMASSTNSPECMCYSAAFSLPWRI